MHIIHYIDKTPIIFAHTIYNYISNNCIYSRDILYTYTIYIIYDII